jgi:S-adenosylmethionine hydrolase
MTMSAAASFSPSGIISLTTDFGHKGPFIGTMKGQILKRFPAARIIDLTHECSVHWPAEAGFWVSRSYPYFPVGSVHLAVVDPGVGTEREIVILCCDGHLFLAPDNGLLAPFADRLAPGSAYRLDPGRLDRFGVTRVSATFHGRDIFAPLAAELAAGRCHPAQIGVETAELVPSILEDPVAEAGRISGVVVTVDNFGNLITNIDASLVARLRKPLAIVAGHRIAFAATYGARHPGEYLALINSFDVLEIARSEQSAADGLGVERGAPVTLVDSAAA